MTVIAWDGKTLAADKRSLNNDVANTVTKIFRSDSDTLMGLSGHLGRAMQMMRWIEACRIAETFPKGTTDDDWAVVLVVHRNGAVEKYESREFPITFDDPCFAMGSARDFALMAMHLGHDARRAVELTCELSVICGNGIDTLSFDDANGGDG